GLGNPLEGLVRVAQAPQNPGRLASAGYGGIMTGVPGVRLILGRRVKRNGLLQVLQRGYELTAVSQGHSQCPVTLNEKKRVWIYFAQSEQLFCNGKRSPHLLP